MAALLLGMVIAIPLGASGPSAAAGPPATFPRAVEALSSDSTRPHGRPSFGVSTEGAPGGTELQQLVREVGRVPDEIMWFVAWGLGTGFPTEDATRVRDLGALPVITWEPWDTARGADQTTYTMRSIARGRHDAYVRAWARGARAFGSPVVLRFAHEVNGTWYPWSPGVDGTSRRHAVAAWRHVRQVFWRQGADEVLFRWSPNVPFPGSTPMARVWPGSKYVDQVALDGYNWGGFLPGTTWLSFEEVLAEGLRELGDLTSLPVHAGETASPERASDGSGDKAAWIRAMFDTVRADPRLAGFTWFHHLKEQDWRITSSSRSLDAFRAGLRSWG